MTKSHIPPPLYRVVDLREQGAVRPPFKFAVYRVDDGMSTLVCATTDEHTALHIAELLRTHGGPPENRAGTAITPS